MLYYVATYRTTQHNVLHTNSVPAPFDPLLIITYRYNIYTRLFRAAVYWTGRVIIINAKYNIGEL